MKSILMSIRPEWCKKIFDGEKTIEVRKTRPLIDMPFKVLVYETKAQFVKSIRGACTTFGYGRGKVIGSFICDRINEIYQCNSGWVKENACLSRGEFFDYLGIPRDTHGGYDKKVFGWHITEPKLFDKPRELGEFFDRKGEPIKRAFQSWGYCYGQKN